jgi:branched-chain amino acid aminotransferase
MDYRPIRTDIDWSALSFGYMPTRSHIAFHWKDGAWDKGELKTDPNITMSIAATCLHYGQACFEGMKAFRCKDGKVRVFRPWENIARMNRTGHQLLHPEIPEEMYLEAIHRVVLDNIDYVPPCFPNSPATGSHRGGYGIRGRRLPWLSHRRNRCLPSRACR